MKIDTDIFIVFGITIMFLYACSIEMDLMTRFDKNPWVESVVNDEKPLTSFVVKDVTWRRAYISSVVVCLLILFFVKCDWNLYKFVCILFITFTTLYITNGFFVYHYFLLMYNKIENKVCIKQ